MPDLAAVPTFSVVTPSYNQARFIERTINSVLSQGIAPIDYYVADGGSNDGTVAILQRYADQIRYVSEPDGGQTDAVNKGIAATKGEIVGWLNSDDVYYPGAFAAVIDYFAAHPEVDVIYGNADHIDADDNFIEDYYTEDWNFDRLTSVCFICQPAVFFRRSALEKIGPLDTTLNYCMDYELWIRLAKAGCQFGRLPKKLAGSRLYAETKTLGSRRKVHAEINDMLLSRLGYVPDRWLSNFAHVLLEDRPAIFRKRPIFIVLVSILTLLSSLRWNRAIRPSLKQMVREWMSEVLPGLRHSQS